MKKIISLLLVMVAACALNSASAAKIYYVVQGSYSSFQKAKDAYEGAVYRTSANGKTVYRTCPACFYSLSDAKDFASALKEHDDVDAWVWPSDTKLSHLDPCEGSECSCMPYKSIPSTMTFYYVIEKTNNTLSAAKDVHVSDWEDYDIIVDGSKYYASFGRYTTHAEAQKSVNRLARDGRKCWIWAHAGHANYYYGNYTVDPDGSIFLHNVYR